MRTILRWDLQMFPKTQLARIKTLSAMDLPKIIILKNRTPKSYACVMDCTQLVMVCSFWCTGTIQMIKSSSLSVSLKACFLLCAKGVIPL